MQKSFSPRSINANWQISSYRNLLRWFPNRQASQVSFSWTQGAWSAVDGSHLCSTVSEALRSCFQLQGFCLFSANAAELLKPSDTFTYRSKPSDGEASGLSNSSASALPAPASPQPPCLTWRIQVDKAARKARRSRQRQAIEAPRFHYFIQFSGILYSNEYDEYSRLWGRIEALPVAMSESRFFTQTFQGTLCVSRELGAGNLTVK